MWITLLCWCQHVSSDTLVIEKVTCQRVATGIDNYALLGAQALGALISGGITAAGGLPVILGTGGTGAPVTFGMVAAAAYKGSKYGKQALEFLNSKTSGTDDLIININGEQIWPVGGGHGSIEAGDVIQPNLKFDFDGAGARIQFIEFDSGSDNDNLGSIDVNPDVSPGKDYRVDDAVLLNKDEGDLYYVTYRIERNNKGKDKAKWIMCGTAACKFCADDPCCEKTTNKGLDRDGDYGDLRSCPPGFSDKGWKTYDLKPPAVDVYLRICGNQLATSPTKCELPPVSGIWLRRMPSRFLSRMTDTWSLRTALQKHGRP